MLLDAWRSRLALLAATSFFPTASLAENRPQADGTVRRSIALMVGPGEVPQDLQTLVDVLLVDFQATCHIKAIRARADECKDDTACLAGISRKLGVDLIATVSDSRLSATTTVLLRIIDVSAAAVVATVQQDVASASVLSDAARALTKRAVPFLCPSPNAPPAVAGRDGESPPGGLTAAEVGGIIQSHWGEIKLCYEQQLVKDPQLAGEIGVHFQIGPEGSVAHPRIRKPVEVPKDDATRQLHNLIVEECMLTNVREWKFPKPRGGGFVDVNYPFVFTSGK